MNSSADITPPAGSNLSILPASHTCLEAGQTAVVNFKAKDGEALAGYQFALAIDPNDVELTGVNKGALTPFSLDYFNLEDMANGHLKAIWYDELSGGTVSISPAKTLFQLNIKAKTQVCHIDQIVDINTAAMPAAFYDAAGHELAPELSLELIPQVIRHQLQAVYPNPASNDLSFQFKVNDQSAQVSITVQDAGGNTVQHSGQYAIGEHTFVFTNTSSLNNGLLSYAVSIGTDTFSGNVIKL